VIEDAGFIVEEAAQGDHAIGVVGFGVEVGLS
jgi:hypothetical protein